MKGSRIFNTIKRTLLTIYLYLSVFQNMVLANALKDEPYRLRDAETYFANAVIAIWVLSIPYFIFVISSIGFQWMLSGGDENKLAGLKQRGGNVAASFGLVFGGYIVVKLVLSLLGLRDPASCFVSPLGTNVIFKFFFPEACN